MRKVLVGRLGTWPQGHPVTVNGQTYRVKRDEVNELPDSVIEVLETAGFEVLDVPDEE